MRALNKPKYRHPPTSTDTNDWNLFDKFVSILNRMWPAQIVFTVYAVPCSRWLTPKCKAHSNTTKEPLYALRSNRSATVTSRNDKPYTTCTRPQHTRHLGCNTLQMTKTCNASLEKLADSAVWNRLRASIVSSSPECSSASSCLIMCCFSIYCLFNDDLNNSHHTESNDRIFREQPIV